MPGIIVLRNSDNNEVVGLFETEEALRTFLASKQKANSYFKGCPPWAVDLKAREVTADLRKRGGVGNYVVFLIDLAPAQPQQGVIWVNPEYQEA